MNDLTISITIAALSLCVSAIVGFSTLKRARSGDDKELASMETTVLVKLETMQETLVEIKTEMNSIKEDLQELRDRLIIVEQSTKSAHKRLDSIGAEKRYD